MSHAPHRTIRRTAPNVAALLSGNPVSFHCRRCGRLRFEAPHDVGTSTAIVLICAECADERAAAEE